MKSLGVRDIGVLSFVAGAVLASVIFFFIFRYEDITAAPGKPFRLADSRYPLINPLLFCNLDQQKNYNEDTRLESDINSFIQARVARGLADSISAYVINYEAGTWSGVNENERYDPASLLKVPLMITYLKASESDPKVLSQQYAYEGDDQNADEYYRSAKNIEPGKYYSVDTLIQSMIVNSDNTAAVLLERSIGSRELTEIYTDLNLPIPRAGSNTGFISAKSYSYFFRLLYNSTFLSRENSQKALALLAEPDKVGIRDGLPQDIVVAQKFGERTLYSPDGSVVHRELHDCGIVYKKDSPYLLCVMSRGSDFPSLAKNIADLSALVYEKIGSYQ